jgi:hypothetical protein
MESTHAAVESAHAAVESAHAAMETAHAATETAHAATETAPEPAFVAGSYAVDFAAVEVAAPDGMNEGRRA